MKIVYLSLVMSMAAFPVYAEAPHKAIPLFPDAPPPPQIAEAPLLFCCTVAGRLTLVQPGPDEGKPIAEGAACESKTPDGAIQTGTVCY